MLTTKVLIQTRKQEEGDPQFYSKEKNHLRPTTMTLNARANMLNAGISDIWGLILHSSYNLNI